jgi:hypothetical protein
MDFREAFVLWRGLDINYTGGVLEHPARVAIHFTHRLGALIATLAVFWAALSTLRVAPTALVRRAALWALGALGLQLSIAIAMILHAFPLPLAAGHNGWCRRAAAVDDSAQSKIAGASKMNAPAAAVQTRPTWRLYLELTKPKVVALIVFTAIVGTLLAVPGVPPLDALVFGNLGIALASGCAATINHVLDQKIDEQMSRTRGLPAADRRSRHDASADVRGGARCSLDVNSLVAGESAHGGAHVRVVDRLCRDRHRVAEAGDLAEHRHRRCRQAQRRRSSVGGGDEFDRTASLVALPHHLHLDTAALLGARDRTA